MPSPHQVTSLIQSFKFRRTRTLSMLYPKKPQNGPRGLQTLSEKNLATVFFAHLARTLGMFCGILNQTLVINSHTAFGQLFWFSGKMRFRTKSAKTYNQKQTPEGYSFWPYGRIEIVKP